MIENKTVAGAWSRVKKWARKHAEYITILAALILLLSFPSMIRGIDPTAAPIDPGILSAILLSVVAVLVFMSVTWWIIRMIWPVFADYSCNHFERNFKTLTACQKVLIYLGFYLALFVSFVAALVAIL